MSGLRSRIRTPFFTGGGLSTQVPHPWDIAINGRTFMYDTKFFASGQMTRSSIKLLAPRQDSGAISEQSLNPAEGIRAKIESWHHGAGQTFLDRTDADEYRFRSSKGVDPWTMWQLSLLPDTVSVRSSANTNLALEPVGSYLYLADGQQVYHTTSLTGTPTWTSADIFDGEVAQSVKSIASDGYYLYAALGSNGIHRTVRGDTASAHYSDLSCTLIGYVKGRLMAANGNAIYNVIASGAAPSALYTHPNTDFTWVGFAEGLGHVYAAGYSGDRSLVYRTSIKADGTALDVPIVAGSLPDGEIVRSISSYLTLILIGTDSGVWVAEQDSEGNLSLNKVVDTPAAVRCFEGQGTFVWFGWSAYDSTSSGLGRMDLTQSTAERSVITPAYASDLMATTQDDVLAVATFDGARVFAISGVGVYTESSDRVASGTIDTGLITFGFPDDKVPTSLLLSYEALAGQINVAVSSEGGEYSSIGTAVEQGSTSTRMTVGADAGENFELELTLSRDESDITATPVVTRVTLEANPAPGRGEMYTVALLFRDVLDVDGRDIRFDCPGEYRRFLEWETAGAPVTFQDCMGTDSVVIDDHDFIIENLTQKRDGYQGTLLASLRRPRRV